MYPANKGSPGDISIEIHPQGMSHGRQPWDVPRTDNCTYHVTILDNLPFLPRLAFAAQKQYLIPIFLFVFAIDTQTTELEQSDR